MLERNGHEQIAPFDAVLVLELDQTLSTTEPSTRRPDLTSDREGHPDPEGAARCAWPVAGVQAHLVSTLQERQEVVHATDHGGRDREQLEVVRPQRRGLVGARQRLVGVQPRPLCIGLTAAVQFVPAHLAAILAPLLRRRGALGDRRLRRQQQQVAFDHCFCDLDESAAVVLRVVTQHVECLVGVDCVPCHEDALGLLDQSAPPEGALQAVVLGESLEGDVDRALELLRGAVDDVREDAASRRLVDVGRS